MKADHFGETRFKQIFRCQTYGMRGLFKSDLYKLLDHGFIADRACVWDKRLKGHELAIIARTYCNDDAIDNPPDGLHCIRLDDSVLGCDPGTAIAVVVTEKTAAAETLLTACTGMPADMLAYMLPLSMLDEGYCIALKTGVHDEDPNSPVVRLVKSL
jgi:hypothetical protein